MTLSEIVVEVGKYIRDPALKESDVIVPLINDRVLRIAEEVFLPPLRTTFTVATATDAPSVDLPATFHRGLYRVDPGDGGHVRIFESMDEMQAEYGTALDGTGSRVDSVAVDGTKLFYQPIPTTSTTLTLYGYKYPEVLDEDGPEGTVEELTCLPSHLHRWLLVDGVLELLFEIKEYAMEGPKANRDEHRSNAEFGMTLLRRHIRSRYGTVSGGNNTMRYQRFGG